MMELYRRPRRNRQSAAVRGLVRETHLRPERLVYPLFLLDGERRKETITSLPMASRLSLDYILAEIEASMKLGINSFILFPAIPDENKDKTATFSYNENNFYLRAARAIKDHFPECMLISDVAMDPYNSDGHDGLVAAGKVLNDATLPILADMSIAQAEAGFDFLGPSDMMDGRIEFIRAALDEADYTDTGILAYTAKYASSFYGPFRDALDSAPKDDPNIPKDKKTYQMDPANRREAILEAELDEDEGADMLMVKPALHYLDIIRDLRNNTELPVAAYHVSGECAMLWAACQNGWLEYEKAMPETLLSIHRAGADIILTYYAKEYAQMWKDRAGNFE
ncbi:MAG: porphobilinogen synthase [Bacteroidota bacterium]